MTQNTSSINKHIVQHDLVRESFYIIKERNQLDEFIETFYQNLLSNNPTLSRLFKEKKMDDLVKKMRIALRMMVHNWVNLNKLELMIKPLGCRHVTYGVKSEYYSVFGETLVSTLKDYLKDDWSPEIEKAWFDTYNQIVSLMLQGVNEEK